MAVSVGQVLINSGGFKFIVGSYHSENGSFDGKVYFPSNYKNVQYSLNNGSSWSPIPSDCIISITSNSAELCFKGSGSISITTTQAPIQYEKYPNLPNYTTDGTHAIYWYGNRNGNYILSQDGSNYGSNTPPNGMDKAFLCDLFDLPFSSVSRFGNFIWNTHFYAGNSSFVNPPNSKYHITGWFNNWATSAYPIISSSGTRNWYRRAIMVTAYFNSGSGTTTTTYRSTTYSVGGITGSAIKFYDKYSGSMQVINDNPYEVDRDVIIYWDQESGYNYSVSNSSFTDLSGNTHSKSISRDDTLYDYGTYNLKVTKTATDGSATISASIIIIIKDPTPADSATIYNKLMPSIIYTEDNQVFAATQYPTAKAPDGCTITEATLNDQGFTLGQSVSENGTYSVKITTKRTSNGSTAYATGIFEIDSTPPNAPTVNINSTNNYQGKDFGLVGSYPNPISVAVTADDGCTVTSKAYFRLKTTGTWVEIPFSNIYSDKGEYKIDSYAHKTRNGLDSDHTIVCFFKKVKATYTITLNPDGLCYRTFASINFPTDDPTLKCQYRINYGEWKWYREPVRIYDNCTISCRSLDGADDYESYITTKTIDIIDKIAPDAPVFTGVTEGEIATTVIPNIE